jgi:hypothetical protein
MSLGIDVDIKCMYCYWCRYKMPLSVDSIKQIPNIQSSNIIEYIPISCTWIALHFLTT